MASAQIERTQGKKGQPFFLACFCCWGAAGGTSNREVFWERHRNVWTFLWQAIVGFYFEFLGGKQGAF